MSESLGDFVKVQIPVLLPHLLDWDLGVVGPRNLHFPQVSQMLLMNIKVYILNRWFMLMKDNQVIYQIQFMEIMAKEQATTEC